LELISKENSPFWARYPEKYVKPQGYDKFKGYGNISEDHEKWISEYFFEVVGACNRFPRYKNKRGWDPQVKCFMDLKRIRYDKQWDLPTPNQPAAYKSLAKYGKATVNMAPENVEMLNQAWEFMKKQFYPYMGNSNVVSLQEAVNRLDMSSSSGSPFNELYAKKKDLFEKDPEIMEWLESDWEALAEDPKWTTIFSSSLKEELRPLGKIEENSLRTFAAGAVDATVHGNRLFVEMNEKMYDSHLKSASTIGMTPLKGNWDRLLKKLSVFSKGYALDESQYDSSLREFLMWGCAKFRWECLSEKDKTPANLRRIRTYYRNLVNTLMLTPEGILLLKKLGNPSGSVNTVTDNTLILYWLMAYAWIKMAPEDMKTYQEFELHTSKALLGDDNTWTVSDLAHEFYNGVSVIETWKSVGVTTTTDSLKPRLPEDLDFLSAHTVFVGGYAVPLYDRNKLMQSLVYAPTLHLTPETTLTRVTCLLQVGWTDLQFRRFCRSLIDYLMETYDHILKDDQRWIIAKSGIQSDEFYFALFTGKQIILTPQSYQESKERLNKLDKSGRMASISVKPQKQQRKRNQRRGPKRGRKAVKVVAVKQQQRRKAPRRKRANREQLTGKGSVRNLGSRMMNRRGCTIQEDEFVAAVLGSVGFATTQYPLQPGQVLTFPWLSQEAKLWERYTFEHLEFYYKRDVSEFATNGTTGKVMFSVDFDASDPPPATKTQVEDTYPHADAMPCENFRLIVDPRSLHPGMLPKYVRPGGLPGAADIKLYDAGNLAVSTQGNQNTSEVGELRVKYTVRFENPIIENNAGPPTNNSVAQFVSQGAEAIATGVATTLALATASFNGVIAVNTAGLIVLPAGNYLIDANVQFAAVGGVFTDVTLGFLKNGGTYGSTNRLTVTAAGTISGFNMNTDSLFYQSNGTDTLAISVNGTISAGTETAVGALRIVAL
jgi:hypothetical protein